MLLAEAKAEAVLLLLADSWPVEPDMDLSPFRAIWRFPVLCSVGRVARAVIELRALSTLQLCEF